MFSSATLRLEGFPVSVYQLEKKKKIKKQQLTKIFLVLGIVPSVRI